jgi:hypothetical protein
MTDLVAPVDHTPNFRDYGVRQEVIDDTLAFILEYEDVFKALAKNDLVSLVKEVEAEIKCKSLCDCCFEPATVFVSELDQITPQVTTIHCWCDRHEHWWQRAIYELRRLWREAREDY